jgi:hypothetical protein
MLEVEPYIVELIDQLGKMRSPITCREGLQLANSLVNGKSIMENIQIWRRKHCISFRDEQQLTKELGKGYWRGFMKRNGLNVKAKKVLSLTANVRTGVPIRTSKQCMPTFTKRW